MIGNVTFYVNELWSSDFDKSNEPSITGETYTCSGGETSGAIYDIVDGRQETVVTIDTNGQSTSPDVETELTNDITDADFFIVDNHNLDTAGSDLSIRDSGGSNLALSGYWGGTVGEELTAQSYSGGINSVQQPTDGIFLGILDTASTDDQWILHLFTSTTFATDITIGQKFVGKKREITLAPDMPEFYNNYDGIGINTSAGGQKTTIKNYGERKAWKLRWSYIDDTNYQKILTVWGKTEGPRYPFFIDLGETTNPTLYFVRFIENSLQSRKLANNAYEVSILIESEV